MGKLLQFFYLILLQHLPAQEFTYLGNYNEPEVADHLELVDDFMTYANMLRTEPALPESYLFPDYNPQCISAGYDKNFELAEVAAVGEIEFDHLIHYSYNRNVIMFIVYQIEDTTPNFELIGVKMIAHKAHNSEPVNVRIIDEVKTSIAVDYRHYHFATRHKIIGDMESFFPTEGIFNQIVPSSYVISNNSHLNTHCKLLLKQVLYGIHFQSSIPETKKDIATKKSRLLTETLNKPLSRVAFQVTEKINAVQRWKSDKMVGMYPTFFVKRKFYEDSRLCLIVKTKECDSGFTINNKKGVWNIV